ncbi:DNA-binding protein SMUBP-2 [Anopheles merus]|uniref:AN1-type domain-containing protein n=1 Tax=Anopheles merus TaxID=30066 RepID=A0A182VHU4_ANOME|nr:DNA-binding protein SMUBP-2 [Anopheles merus]XP_041766773.1 DNA-binding protein SMUBP-2 [Anopheles merus]
MSQQKPLTKSTPGVNDAEDTAGLVLNTDPKVVTKAAELLQPIRTEVVDKNLDKVLEAVKTVDLTCDFKGCKQKTNLVGTDCSFCKDRFCFKHSLPEIHGCGEAVKRKERELFLHPMTGKAKAEQYEKQKAQVRLTQKLKQMSLERKQKPSSGGSSKTGGSTASSTRGGASSSRGRKRTNNP